MDFVLVGIGMICLFLGGEAFVRGSAALSLRYGVPRLLVGMTVIAFGTSLPELLVSLQSALTGHGDIVLGNVVGSNIANILLILGVPAAMATLPCDGHGTVLGWVQVLFVTLLLFVLLLFAPLGLWQGLVLLGVLAVIYTHQIRQGMSGDPTIPVDVDESVEMLTLQRTLFYILAGAILLPLGANAMVTGAVNIAYRFGISEAVVGLTVVAIGTSLPELAASVSAVRKGENALAIGNVIGSNLLNITLILGVTSVVTPVSVSPQIVRYDLPFLILVTLGLGIFVLRKMCISRAAGFSMVAIYLAYLGSLIWAS